MGTGLQDSSTAAGRRSGAGIGSDVSTSRTAANAQRLRAEVRRESPDERAVKMPEAEDAATTHTGAALEQVDSAAALIAVGG